MGLRDQATIRSDSGYGDDVSEVPHDGSDAHPLSKLICSFACGKNRRPHRLFEFFWFE
ncbi:hypothetical protein M434DRAFT_397546 [Hypoxylon sp. CO27-5]|nr:hypothetical protein M434DRAFT_397546 [Hypoxylon sp. CO27-5]